MLNWVTLLHNMEYYSSHSFHCLNCWLRDIVPTFRGQQRRTCGSQTMIDQQCNHGLFMSRERWCWSMVVLVHAKLTTSHLAHSNGASPEMSICFLWRQGNTSQIRTNGPIVQNYSQLLGSITCNEKHSSLLWSQTSWQGLYSWIGKCWELNKINYKARGLQQNKP